MFKALSASTVVLATILFMTGSTNAASYPSRTINLVVPFSAGGGGDLVARNFAMHFEKYIGKSVVVSNKDGGAGTIGTSAVAHAKPDGYTLLLAVVGPTVLQPWYGGTDYTMADLKPVANLTNVSTLIAVNKNSGITDLKSFIDYAKANPGAIKLSVAAANGLPHLATARFAKQTGIDVKIMPYKGANPAVAACLGGHVQGFVGHPSETLAMVQNGDLIPIVVFEPQRLAQMPQMPTAAESGYDVTMGVWRAIGVPAKTPDSIVKIISDAVAKTVQDPAYIEGLKKIGEGFWYLNTANTVKHWNDQSAIFEQLTKELGLYMQNKR